MQTAAAADADGGGQAGSRQAGRQQQQLRGCCCCGRWGGPESSTLLHPAERRCQLPPGPFQGLCVVREVRPLGVLLALSAL
jgi:hypothetical protein